MDADTAIDVRLWDDTTVSAKTGIPRGTLRQHRHRGVGLPYVRIGHRIWYRPADVADYLAANTVTPTPATATD